MDSRLARRAVVDDGRARVVIVIVIVVLVRVVARSLVVRHRSRARRESSETVGARPSRAGRPRRPIGRARDGRARDANASSNATKTFRASRRANTHPHGCLHDAARPRKAGSIAPAREADRSGGCVVCVCLVCLSSDSWVTYFDSCKVIK